MLISAMCQDAPINKTRHCGRFHPQHHFKASPAKHIGPAAKHKDIDSPKRSYKVANAAASEPIMEMAAIRNNALITNPAIANPLGCLKIPANENIKPSTNSTKLSIGTQQNTAPKIASTNPPVPSPLLLLPCWLTITVVCPWTFCSL